MDEGNAVTIVEDGFIYDYVENSFGEDSTGYSGHGVPQWYGSAEGDYSPPLEDPVVEEIWSQYVEEGVEPDVAEGWAVSAAKKLREAESFEAEGDVNVSLLSELSLILANMEIELDINSEDYEDFTTYSNPIHRLGAAIAQIEQEFGVKEEDFQAESFEGEVFGEVGKEIQISNIFKSALENQTEFVYVKGSGPFKNIFVDISGSMQAPIGHINQLGVSKYDNTLDPTRLDLVKLIILEGMEEGVIVPDCNIIPWWNQIEHSFKYNSEHHFWNALCQPMGGTDLSMLVTYINSHQGGQTFIDHSLVITDEYLTLWEEDEYNPLATKIPCSYIVIGENRLNTSRREQRELKTREHRRRSAASKKGWETRRKKQGKTQSAEDIGFEGRTVGDRRTQQLLDDLKMCKFWSAQYNAFQNAVYSIDRDVGNNAWELVNDEEGEFYPTYGTKWKEAKEMMMAEVGMPVIPNTYGEDSALISGHGVPQWYGSAEEAPECEIANRHKTLCKICAPFYRAMEPKPKWSSSIFDAESFSEWSQPCDVCGEGTLAQYGDDSDLWVIIECDNCDFSQDIKMKEAETFEAPMSVFPPGSHDIKTAKSRVKLKHPKVRFSGKPIYLTYREGSSNKFHVFFNTNMGYFNVYGRIGYAHPQVFGPMGESQYHDKLRSKMRKGYQKTKAAESFGAEGAYEVGLPVIPNSWGGDSALTSGYGVPQWYGSAEHEGRRYRGPTTKQRRDISDAVADVDYMREVYSADEIMLELDKPVKTGAGLAFGFILASVAAVAGATLLGVLAGGMGGQTHE